MEKIPSLLSGAAAEDLASPLPLRGSPPKSRSNLPNSPFRYAGGKFYARKIILGVLPEHQVFCEPFAGGASVFFAKPATERSILNDLDEGLMTTFRIIRDRVEDLIAALEGVKATKKNHRYYKHEFQPKDDLERALRWYFLNRTSYSGIMKPENCYWGFGRKYSMVPKNWPPHLRTCSDKLQGVELESKDFEEIIETLPDGSFAFIDPPYYEADQHKFYTCPFTREDHERLERCLRRNARRIKFLLTYDDVPATRDLYAWATVTSEAWNYTISRTDDQKNGVKLKDGYRGGAREGARAVYQELPCRVTGKSSPISTSTARCTTCRKSG